MAERADFARTVSRSLSGYLCGTHSGTLRGRRGDRLSGSALARAHRELLGAGQADAAVELGGRPWEPPSGSAALARGLRTALDADQVVDLVLYGSQARGSTTGFSDVDAVLVIRDDAAASPAALRALRRRVLVAQRHVLSHQPMQHHGFEVATPALLNDAGAALGLPREAVAAGASLFGRGARATFREEAPAVARARLERLARELRSVARWPRHPWLLHRTVSMFELLPALFLQSTGRRVEKWRSFEVSRGRLADAWWPYDVLETVRATWANDWPRPVRTALRVAPNPWLAMDLWRRLPAAASPAVRALLDDDTLRGLHAVMARMESEAGS